LLCLVLLSSCAKNHEEPGELPDTGDVKESLIESTETDTPPVESIPAETIPNETLPTETLPNETLPPETEETTGEEENIGGGNIGDMLMPRYSPLVDIVVCKDGTFTEEYYKYMDDYDSLAIELGRGRPSLIYYIVHATGADREDIEKYYKAIEVEDVPERIYQGLLTDDLIESMQLLKYDNAFYTNGKLYNIYDVYEQYTSKSLTFDINDPVYDEVWENIISYISQKNVTDSINPNILEFIKEHTQKTTPPETTAPETTAPVDDTPAEYIISEDGSIIYTPKYYSGSYRVYDFVDYDDEEMGDYYREMYPSKAYNENVNIELEFTVELDKTVYKAGDSFWIGFKALNVGEPFMYIDCWGAYFESQLVHSEDSGYIFRSDYYFYGRDLPDADAFETLIETGETRVDAIPYTVTEDTPLGKYDLYVYFSGYILKVNDALEIVE